MTAVLAIIAFVGSAAPGVMFLVLVELGLIR